MPFNVGPLELVIVLIIALLVIGPKRLPEMGNSIGKTIREFRNASSDVQDAVSLEADAKPATQQMAAAPPAAPAAAPTTPAEAPAPEPAAAGPAAEETSPAPADSAEPTSTTAEAVSAETPAEPKSDA